MVDFGMPDGFGIFFCAPDVELLSVADGGGGGGVARTGMRLGVDGCEVVGDGDGVLILWCVQYQWAANRGHILFCVDSYSRSFPASVKQGQ